MGASVGELLQCDAALGADGAILHGILNFDELLATGTAAVAGLQVFPAGRF
jgi:hypothetical protein